MTQRNEVLTREENRISSIATRRTTTQEDYLTITEREILANTTERTWILEVGEETRVGGVTARLVSTLLKIVKWLSCVGSGKIDASRLEARHNIHHNFRAKGLGL